MNQFSQKADLNATQKRRELLKIVNKLSAQGFKLSQIVYIFQIKKAFPVFKFNDFLVDFRGCE